MGWLAALTVITVLLMVTSRPAVMPLSVGLLQVIGIHSTDFPVLMAGSLLAALPMMMDCFVLQRHFIDGIASQA